MKSSFNAKLSAISFAILGSLAAVGNAQAAGVDASGAIAGQAQVAGQYTVGQVSAGVSSTSTSEGNAVAATKVYGPNSFSNAATTSVSGQDTSASIGVTPTSVTTVTNQVSTASVSSKTDQSGNLPTLDSAGLLVNGTAGVAQSNGVANAVANQTIAGMTGAAGIEGSAGISANGQISGY